jgi:hypothetical protein
MPEPFGGDPVNSPMVASRSGKPLKHVCSDGHKALAVVEGFLKARTG